MASPMPPPTFKNLVTELASTALVCLGHIGSPVTGRKEHDLERARHVIDLLAMLDAKTKGNLTGDEAEYVSVVVTDLRMKYLEAAPSQGRLEPESPPGPQDRKAPGEG